MLESSQRPCVSAVFSASGCMKESPVLWGFGFRIWDFDDPKAKMLSLQSFLRKGVSLGYVGSI